MRELRREEIAPTRPEHYSVLVSASETTIAVKLYFVEPFLAFGNSLDGEGIHRLDEPYDGVKSGCLHSNQSKGVSVELLDCLGPQAGAGTTCARVAVVSRYLIEKGGLVQAVTRSQYLLP